MNRLLAFGVLLLAWVAPLPVAHAAAVPAAPYGSALYDDGGLQQGIDFYHAGQFEQALSLLQAFVAGHPEAPRLGEAFSYLARTVLELGQPDEALRYLERIDAERLAPADLLTRGAALVQIGEAQRGIELLQQIETARLASAEQVRHKMILSEAYLVLGQPLAALLGLHQGLALPGADPQALLGLAHEVLQSHASDGDLEDAELLFRGTALGMDALLQQAERALARKNIPTARRLADAVVNSTTPFPYRHEAVKLWERLTGSAWRQRAIGVLLPLSGRYATFGELVRRGMDLALEMYNPPGDPVEFQYQDIAGDPERAARAVTRMANEAGVMAIAGPLTASAAAVAAQRAQLEKVPLLTLSPREGLPQTGEYVFRDSLTSRQQVQSLVRYAMEYRGLSSFAVLYPESRLGREMADLFNAEVEFYGGEVCCLEGYAEDATDFRRQILLLKGQDPDAPEEPSEPLGEEALLEDLFVPDAPPLPFEALFIPDYADRIGLIAPQLVFYGIDEVPLLGINGWNSPDLLRLAGRFVEGATFVDGFYLQSTSPQVVDFVARYRARHGEDPTILEAQGFDAARLLLRPFAEGQVLSREDLWLALVQLQGFRGVTGATSFDAAGDAIKELFLLQVRNGRIEQLIWDELVPWSGQEGGLQGSEALPGEVAPEGGAVPWSQ